MTVNLREMMDKYYEEGLTRELASARVCQDIVLKAISEGPLNQNITIKGGVVMRSITRNNRRATRDIDLDFIHYSISDDSVMNFVSAMNCIDGINIDVEGKIKELKHQDYHGKSIDVVIKDEYGNLVSSKIDIGVHRHFEIEQDSYCFDVCMDERGASLLKNSNEQAFTEKLKSLLILGSNSRRYKDIFDMYYLKSHINDQKLIEVIELLILSDPGMREHSIQAIVDRVLKTFGNEQYLERVSASRQRWIDDEIHDIADGIIEYLSALMRFLL